MTNHHVAQSRPRLVLHLVGGDHPDGEIPLDRVASIAEHTQELILRIARGLSGREAAGRPPDQLREDTRLLLVGLRKGSTTLDIAGPHPAAELELPVYVPPSVIAQTMEVLGDALVAVQEEHSLPARMSAPARHSFRSWLRALASYQRFDAGVEGPAGNTRRVIITPEATRRLLDDELGPSESENKLERSATGLLYMVNLRTGRFSIEDDLGDSLTLNVPEPLRRNVRMLVGAKVEATGAATLDERGRIHTLAVTSISAAETVDGLDREAFWQGQELTTRLREGRYGPTIDDLTLEGVTSEEIDNFWAALEGR